MSRREGSAMITQAWKRWRACVGLVGLSLVPVVAGASRLTQLAGTPHVTEENARFVAAPVPVVLHIVTVTVFALVGAVQFPTARWAAGRRWHRRAGRVVAVAGVLAAASGLWMAASYPLPATDDESLTLVRFAVGGFMLVALVVGVVAIRSRNVRRHRAWMLRAYAVGLGAGTQVFTHLPYLLLVGTPSGTARTLLMAAGWAINLAVAEWLIRGRRRRLGAGAAPQLQPSAL